MWRFPFLALSNSGLLLFFHQLFPTANPAPHQLGGVKETPHYIYSSPLPCLLPGAEDFFAGLLGQGGAYAAFKPVAQVPCVPSVGGQV